MKQPYHVFFAGAFVALISVSAGAASIHSAPSSSYLTAGIAADPNEANGFRPLGIQNARLRRAEVRRWKGRQRPEGYQRAEASDEAAANRYKALLRQRTVRGNTDNPIPEHCQGLRAHRFRVCVGNYAKDQTRYRFYHLSAPATGRAEEKDQSPEEGITHGSLRPKRVVSPRSRQRTERNVSADRIPSRIREALNKYTEKDVASEAQIE